MSALLAQVDNALRGQAAALAQARQAEERMSRSAQFSTPHAPPILPDRVQMAVEAVALAHWRRNPNLVNYSGVIPRLARGTINAKSDFGPVTLTVYDPPPEVRDPRPLSEIARERLNRWVKESENPAKELP